MSPGRLSVSTEEFAAAIRTLFPTALRVAAERVTDGLDGLMPQEAIAVRNAAPKRQREFRAGRVAARRALLDLGMTATAIPVGADRAPVWPDGIVGSISHAGDVAVAIVGPAKLVNAVGIDIEIDSAVRPDVWRLVLGDKERAWVESVAPGEQSRAATSVFSAKEAFYKLQHPLTGSSLDFQEVEVRVVPSDTFVVNVPNPPNALLDQEFRGRLAHIGGFTVAALHLSGRSPSEYGVRPLKT